MFRILLAKQVVLDPDRETALRQAMGIRAIIDSVILGRRTIKHIKERVDYFTTLEDYDSDALRLSVWIEYTGKNVKVFLRNLPLIYYTLDKALAKANST